MKNIAKIAASLIAVAFFSGAQLLAQNSGQHPAQGTYTTPAPEWNTPPPGTEQEQQGYRDGLEAAKLDKLAHRAIDARVSHLYVHPPVKGAAQTDYRAGFEGGYRAALQNGGM